MTFRQVYKNLIYQALQDENQSDNHKKDTHDTYIIKPINGLINCKRLANK